MLETSGKNKLVQFVPIPGLQKKVMSHTHTRRKYVYCIESRRPTLKNSLVYYKEKDLFSAVQQTITKGNLKK